MAGVPHWQRLGPCEKVFQWAYVEDFPVREAGVILARRKIRVRQQPIAEESLRRRELRAFDTVEHAISSVAMNQLHRDMSSGVELVKNGTGLLKLWRCRQTGKPIKPELGERCVAVPAGKKAARRLTQGRVVAMCSVRGDCLFRGKRRDTMMIVHCRCEDARAGRFVAFNARNVFKQQPSLKSS